MRGCQDGTLSDEEVQLLLYTLDSHGRPTIEVERFWQMIDMDPITEQRDRDDQLAFVARQGYQQVHFLDDWSLLRFNRLYMSIIRQLEKEKEAADAARRKMQMSE